MEGNIPEECISAEISLLLRLEKNLADRIDDLVEFGLNDIAELKTAGSLFSLYLMVVRKIDRNGLSAGIGITGIVDRIINEHVRLCSRDEGLVLLRARKALLEFRKH